jgi:hypothetical protein
MKLKVNKDGSGTIEEKVIASQTLVSMINSFMEMGDSASTEEFSLLDEEELRNDALNMGEGVRFLRAEEIKEGNGEGYIAYYEFDDITKIKVDDDPEDKVPSDVMEAGEETGIDAEYITFQFIEGDPATLIINLPPKDEEDLSFEDTEVSEDSLADEAWAEQLQEIFKDLRFSVRVEVDGDISETNATYVNGSEVTIFEMDFRKILENPEKFNEFKKKQPDTFEEMRELLEETPGFKIELEEKVKISFD